MMFVFFGKDDGFMRDAPVDGEGGIVPGYGSLGGRAVQVVALVLEHDFFAEDAEPMGKAPRDEHHPVVLPRQFLGMPLPVI